MKTKKIILLIITTFAVALCLAACADESDASEDKTYTFIYNNVSLYPGGQFPDVYSKLGEPDSYFEANSCAFDGLDKLYTYGSVQISVSELDGVDIIYSITLLDDSLSTPEGISVGSDKSAVISAYGDGYTDNGTSLVYNGKGSTTSLCFLIRDDCVTSVQYRYADNVTGN